MKSGSVFNDESPVNGWSSIPCRFMTFSITTTTVMAAKIDIASLYSYGVSQLRSENRDSSVNIVTELQAGRVKNVCSISDRDRMFCLLHLPDRFRL